MAVGRPGEHQIKRKRKAPQNAVPRGALLRSHDQCATSKWIKTQFTLTTVISTDMRAVRGQSLSAFVHISQKSLNGPTSPPQCYGLAHLR